MRRGAILLVAAAGLGCASMPADLPRFLGGSGKPPPAGEQERAAAKKTRERWATLAAGPGVPGGHRISEGTVLWVRLVAKSLPKEGLTSSSPVGLRFEAITTGLQTEDDRRLVAPGSVLEGEVVEASELREDPFEPARLRLFFYRLTDADERRAAPIAAYVSQAPGFETSSGGVILGHVDIRLADDVWLGVKLLRDVEVQLERNVRGIGVTGTTWAGRRLRVTAILPGSGAEDAGLRVGDEIAEIDGRGLDDYAPWTRLDGEAGSWVSVKLFRGRADKPIKLKCRRGVHVFEGLGLRLHDAPDGPRVMGLVAGSPAERAQVPVGSLLLRAGKDPCLGLKAAACAELLRRRAGAKIEVAFRPPSGEEKVVVLEAAKLAVMLE